MNADEAKKLFLQLFDCVNENTAKECYHGETLMAWEVADMIEDCLNNAPTVDAIPRKFIEDAIAEIESLKGDNFPNKFYVDIIKKHIILKLKKN